MLDATNKWVRLGIFVSLAIDLSIVCAIMVYVAPVPGLIAAAALLVADYFVYRILFKKTSTAGGAPRAAGPTEEEQRESRDMVESSEAVNRAISEAGSPAEATILKAWELGINVNGKNPAMQFLLEVRPADRPAFQASATCVVSQEAISKFQPGSVIQVKYDLEDLTRVAIEHS